MIATNNLKEHLQWIASEKPQIPRPNAISILLKANSSQDRSNSVRSVSDHIVTTIVQDEHPKSTIGTIPKSSKFDNLSTNTTNTISLPAPTAIKSSSTSSLLTSNTKSSVSKTTSDSNNNEDVNEEVVDLTIEAHTSYGFPSNKRLNLTDDRQTKKPRLNSASVDIDYKAQFKLQQEYMKLQDVKIGLLMERVKINESTSISFDEKQNYFRTQFEPKFKGIESKISNLRGQLICNDYDGICTDTHKFTGTSTQEQVPSPTQQHQSNIPATQPSPLLPSHPLVDNESLNCDFSSDNENIEVQVIAKRDVKVPETPSRQTFSDNLIEAKQLIMQARMRNPNNNGNDNNRNERYDTSIDEEDNFGERTLDGLQTPTQERDEYNDLGSFIEENNDESIDGTYTDKRSDLSDYETDHDEPIEDELVNIRLSPDVAENYGIKYNGQLNSEIDLISDDEDFDEEHKEEADDDIEEIEGETFTTQLNYERELSKPDYIEISSDEETLFRAVSPVLPPKRNPQPLAENNNVLNVHASITPISQGDSEHEFSDDDDINLISFPRPSPSKENIPPGTEDFIDEVYKVLNSVFKLKRFRPNQLEAISSTLQGKDSFVLMPTGGGKSLCYQLPALIKSGKTKGTTIVISPLISLMQDQVHHLLNKNIKAGMISSKATLGEHRQTLDLFKNGDLDIVYLSPEKVNCSQHIQSIIGNLYEQNKLARVVIDEAHCLSSWGHDFRPDYKGMSLFKQKFPKAPVMALTATANEKVRMDIIHHLRMSNPVLLKQSFNRTNLFYKIKWKSANYLEGIKDYILCEQNGKTGIIYCHSKQSCEQTSEKLNKWGLKTAFYHAGMSANDRYKVQNLWQTNKLQLICATIAFGMGIDKPDVRFVIHLFIPRSLEGYYQETGRAGRDGDYSECIMFYSYKDARTLQSLIHRDEELTDEGKENHLAKLRQVIQYCENTTDCRRKQVLHYFNESFNPIECQNKCDNCMNASNITAIERDCTEYSKDIIKLVQSIQGGKVTVLHCQDIFKGSNNSKITNAGHHLNPYHGKGKNLDKTDVERIFFYLLSENCLMEYQVMKGGFASNYVKLGKFANKVLNGEKSIKIKFSTKSGSNSSETTVNEKIGTLNNFRYQESFVSARQISRTSSNLINLPNNNFSNTNNNDQGHLDYSYNELNKSRIELSTELNLPITSILTEITLKDMAIKLPTNKKDFAKLHDINKEQLDYFLNFKKLLGILARERKKHSGFGSANMSINNNIVQATDNVSPFFNPSQHDQDVLNTLRDNLSQQNEKLSNQMSKNAYNKNSYSSKYRRKNYKSQRSTQKSTQRARSQKSASQHKSASAKSMNAPKGMPL